MDRGQYFAPPHTVASFSGPVVRAGTGFAQKGEDVEGKAMCVPGGLERREQKNVRGVFFRGP